MPRIARLFLALALTTGAAVAQDRYYCRSDEIPLSWKTSQQPVRVVHSSAAFSDGGTATPALDVQNTGMVAITDLDFVIEYLDEAGHTVDIATIGSSATGFETAMPTPFVVESREPWEKPLGPGEVGRIQSISDGNRTVTCPVSGQITFVAARFRDGRTQQYGSAHWRVRPCRGLCLG